MIVLHVAIQSPEGDGTTNQLLMSGTTWSNSQYAVAISTDKPIPLKLNEWFKAQVDMECSRVYTVKNDGGGQYGWGSVDRSYVCNAKEITINGVSYKHSERD